jgi:hypothetical protein
MANEIVRCTRCKHIHSTKDREFIKGKGGWFHSSCPKCNGHITTDVSENEYVVAISNLIKKSPSLKNKTISGNIHDAFKLGISPSLFVTKLLIGDTK